MGLSRKPVLRARQLHGLVIVAAVFWMNLFVLGFFRASGVLYVAMVRTYQCSHEQASWPFSLAGATLCMTGPIAGALSRTLSMRAIVTTGVIVTGIAISCCFFAENIVVIVILVGIFYGEYKFSTHSNIASLAKATESMPQPRRRDGVWCAI
ncbi:hypothetical protein MRX96_005371 [Rhipicephalus microplus]